MSDSEDDWFEKDIDDFVVDTTPKGVEIISTGVKNSSTEPIALPNAFIDGGKWFIVYSQLNAPII